jgi:hypothetical protein
MVRAFRIRQIRQRQIVFIVEAGKILRIAVGLFAGCTEKTARQSAAIKSVEAKFVHIDPPSKQTQGNDTDNQKYEG